MVRRAGALLVLILAAACSSSRPTPLTHSPEPARAPVPTVTPAGVTTVLPADEPEGVVVVPGSEEIVIAARRPAGLMVVDGDQPPRVEPTDGAVRHLQLSGADVLVPGEDTDVLSVVDPTTGAAVESVAVGPHPHDAVAVGDAIAVTEEDGHAVSIIRRGKVAARITGPDTPGGLAASGDRVGAVAVRGRLLHVIDVPRARQVAPVPIGAGPTHAVTVAAGVLAVTDTTGGAVLLVQISGRPHVLSRTPLPGRPYGLAMDLMRHVLWVSTTGDDRLHGFAVRGSQLVPTGTFPTVQQPNSLAVVPSSGAVVVVGATNPGRLEVVRGSSAP